MSCKFKLRRHNAIPVITIIGELTGEDSAKVSKKITAPGNVKAGTIVIDLSETTFIDSHGLGMLVYTWRTLEEKGCRLVFFDPPPFVQNILQGTNLSHVLHIIDNLDAI